MHHTSSETETKELGAKLAATLRGGDIVCLHGELGAGKTTFVKGIAGGLGIKDAITSPTFTLMNVYEIRNLKLEIRNLVHIDTYRLKTAQELIDIGVEDYLGDPETICVIEWPKKLGRLLENKKTVKVTIEHAGEGKRKIVM